MARSGIISVESETESLVSNLRPPSPNLSTIGGLCNDLARAVDAPLAFLIRLGSIREVQVYDVGGPFDATTTGFDWGDYFDDALAGRYTYDVEATEATSKQLTRAGETHDETVISPVTGYIDAVDNALIAARKPRVTLNSVIGAIEDAEQQARDAGTYSGNAICVLVDQWTTKVVVGESSTSFNENISETPIAVVELPIPTPSSSGGGPSAFWESGVSNPGL